MSDKTSVSLDEIVKASRAEKEKSEVRPSAKTGRRRPRRTLQQKGKRARRGFERKKKEPQAKKEKEPKGKAAAQTRQVDFVGNLRSPLRRRPLSSPGQGGMLHRELKMRRR